MRFAIVFEADDAEDAASTFRNIVHQTPHLPTMELREERLTPAQVERLAILAEECGEVVQMVGKSLRHGLDSYHPEDPERTPNSTLLRRELVDVIAAKTMLEVAGDVKLQSAREIADALRRKQRYTHHRAGAVEDALQEEALLAILRDAQEGGA